ncbi:MFS transporter [Bradyrhizobium sp. INPA03-11B]|uniref:MFS transporter n=1 Tax=Bradyrhizobium sp. INPA03-11B TaxID=418598 RepID=UPI00338FD331
MSRQRQGHNRLDFKTRNAFGIGALSSGLAGHSITALALLFYNQVVGMPPALVGLALMISLVADAFWDPAIGLWSDSTRSRLGRRHPFMYASIVPASLAFWALWNPPIGMSTPATFAYLLGSIMAMRFFVSLYEIASTALIPEIVPDYDARTSLIAGRYFWGVIGAGLASVLAFQGFLSDRVGGITNVAGYARYGVAGALIIAITVVLSTAGTHHQIPKLRQPINASLKMRDLVQQVLGACSNRNFAAIMIAAMFSGINSGVSGGLGVYFNLYFWGLSTDQMSILIGPGLLSAVVGVLLAPMISKRFGKRRVVLWTFALAMLTGTLPIGLRLLGLLPGNDWPWLMPFLVVETFLAATLGLIGLVVVTSMLADVVEDNAVRTAQRSEGLFFSAISVLGKCVTGVGTLISGLMLSWIHFPINAEPDHVDASLMHQLGLIYVPIGIVLSILSLFCLSFFRIDRAQHEANLSLLESAAMAEAVSAESGEQPQPLIPPLDGRPGLAVAPVAGAARE